MAPPVKVKQPRPLLLAAGIVVIMLTAAIWSSSKPDHSQVSMRGMASIMSSCTTPSSSKKQEQTATDENSQWLKRAQDTAQQLRTGSGISASFEPVRISRCEPGMPAHWAPCMNVTGLEITYAEEVIYPAVRIRLPGFLSNLDKDTWMKFLLDRDFIPRRDGYIHLGPKHGQNYVIKDAQYKNMPGGTWTDKSETCLAGLVTISQFEKSEFDSGYMKYSEELFFAITPESWSFQHFTDHLTKPLMQGMHLMGPNTDILKLSGDTPVVREMFTYIPTVNSSKLVDWTGGSRFAKNFIFSCRTPYHAPYSLQKYRELAVGPAANDVPMSQRKVVLYCSRSGGSQRVRNGGRRVLNEEELLSKMRDMLEERKQGETLELLDINKFQSYRELTKWINQNVRAVIGPHGGALMNAIWAAKDTLVLEFQPSVRVNWGIWEMAPVVHLNYWLTVYQSAQNGDMTVDVNKVVQFLNSELGKEQPLGYYVSTEYEWAKAVERQRL